MIVFFLVLMFVIGTVHTARRVCINHTFLPPTRREVERGGTWYITVSTLLPNPTSNVCLSVLFTRVALPCLAFCLTLLSRLVSSCLALPCLVSPIALCSREQGKARQASKYVPVDSC